MVCFLKQKSQIWVNFGGPLIGICWYILWPFGIIHGRLVQFVVICYIFPNLECLGQEKSGNPGSRQCISYICAPSIDTCSIFSPFLFCIKGYCTNYLRHSWMTSQIRGNDKRSENQVQNLNKTVNRPSSLTWIFATLRCRLWKCRKMIMSNLVTPSNGHFNCEIVSALNT
jgi:hypothetical protein